MSTAEYNYRDFEEGGQAEADKSLAVKFFYKTCPKRGSPNEFEEREYIDIRQAGSREAVIRPATARDTERFHEHYRRFKDRTAAPESGTPLKEWALLNSEMVERLSFLNIKTVEQLSAINDVNAPMEVRALNLKQKAINWLEARKNDAAAANLQDALTMRDSQIEQLQGQVSQLIDQVTTLTADTTPVNTLEG